MIESALAYAEVLGLAVFPVAGDCRTPFKEEGLTEHGVYDATKDPERIARLWARWPQANIAMACGAPSGAFALDVDRKGADGLHTLLELEKRHGDLPPTWRQATPSGGLHFFFAHDARRELRNRVGFLPGLDVRTSSADGASRRGSVALAPSRKEYGEYRWELDPTETPLAICPAWLVELIDPPAPPRAPRQAVPVTSTEKAARYVTKAIDEECAAVARTGRGAGRNMRLFMAAANLGELVGAHLVPEDVVSAALEQAAGDSGLTAEDGAHAIRATIKSGLSKGCMNPREVRL